MGEFYELFFNDALKVAPLLDLVITSRQKLDDKPIPLCGVPLSTSEGYISRLVAMGYKVAVCDQVTVPGPGVSLAQREVRRIVTPGTVISAESGSPAVPRYLAALTSEKGSYALAAADISTGDVVIGQWDELPAFSAALASLEPKEIILESDAISLEHDSQAFDSQMSDSQAPDSQAPVGQAPDIQAPDIQAPISPTPVSQAPKSQKTDSLAAIKISGALITNRSPLEFEAQNAQNIIIDTYQSIPCGLSGRKLPISALGALLSYVRELTRGATLNHLAPPRVLSDRAALGLDEAAVRNLELIKNSYDGSEKASLLAQIDLTVTAMGARLLRDWLLRPLVDRSKIEARHGAVEVLSSDLLTLTELKSLLSKLPDLERSLARLTLGRGSLRDLLAARQTLDVAPKIKDLLALSPSDELKKLSNEIILAPGLQNRLKTILADDQGKDGLTIASNVSPLLDSLRDLEAGGRREIAAMEAAQRQRTGINSLKIGFNKVFGYYLEVTKTNLAAVPKDWIRKQTISGGERFITSDLKQWEEKILSAGEKREALETRIIENLKYVTAQKAPLLKNLASVLAQIDALASLASCAEKRGWVKPALSSDDLIDIKGGRHPVVESYLPAGETFVANDVTLSPKERLLVITGPNMAGKSTILRQTALIVILNQMGSFVPASSATLSIRDQVFTRVGAADDLAHGRSTFMVEMSETARILAKATPKSLIILDEVGRGTSTFDGLAIAWAVCEYLHDLGGRGVPTLFATHYHELIELARHKPLTRNYNVSVKRWGDSIVFLRKLTTGGVSRSYGIDVASLAGLPNSVVKRAREVLSDIGRQSPGLIRRKDQRLNLFTVAGLGQDGPTLLAREIAALKPEEISPLEALNILSELKRRASEVLT
jgi:DNA mismatch repair protein MutS